MRIGILGLLHESNTFVTTKTTLADFKADLFLEGAEILQALSTSHHEIGGFIGGLQRSNELDIEIVPLVVYRATPSGPIEKSSFIKIKKNLVYF